jgi:hypothetical protein
MNDTDFIDYLQKRARKTIECIESPLDNYERIEAWKEIENLILTYKKGEY